MKKLEQTWQYVDHWAETMPDAEAIVFKATRVTYAEFKEKVDATAKAMIAAGVQPGDRVALIAMGCPEFFYTYMAANKIGAMWLGISPKFTLHEIRFIIGDCQPTLLFSLDSYLGHDLAPTLAALADEFACLKEIVVVGASDRFLTFPSFTSKPRPDMDDALNARSAATSPDDAALLMYTSGSSGKPKGVIHTHRNIVSNVAVQTEQFLMTGQARCLLHFPINHVAADVEIGFACIYVGGACVMMDHFDAAATLRIVQEERITLFGQVPAMFLLEFGLPAFPETDFSSVQVFAWGGSSAPKLVLDVLAGIAERTGSKLMTGYGSTELCGFVTYTTVGDSMTTLLETAGKCVPPCELRIVDDHRNTLPVGDVGEIAVRGPVTLTTYWNNPEQTRAVLDDDGWYYSGDVGSLDAQGNVRIIARKSEMFKTGGENVYPREVEDVLEQFPGVLMAAVIGVTHPLFQEVGHAFVMPHPGQSPNIDELDSHCRELLANFKVPKTIEVRPMLPLLPNGKVNKQALKTEIHANRSNS